MNFGENSASEKTIKGLSFRDVMQLGERAEERAVKNYSGYRKFVWRVTQFFTRISKSFFLFKFLIDFLGYIIIRSRVVITLLSIVGELGSGYFENFKKVMVYKLFWGRGKFFKFSAQFIGLLLILFVFVSYTYKSATLDSDEYTFMNIYASQNDLLVQGASTNTPIPKDRSRMDSEEYIVKTGDTLSSISVYYGLAIESILWANDLNEDDILTPGDILDIPPGNGLNVEVDEGDNLEDLAEKYSANPQMIIDVNWLDYPFELQIGQKLFIPDGEKPKPAPVVELPVYSGIISGRSGGAPESSAPVDSGVGRFLHWPMGGDGGRLSQCFSGWHNGIDITAPQGTDIVASASGTVSFAGCQSGGCPPLGSLYGGWGLAWSVIVDHGNGFSTIYAHLSEIHVSSGQHVSTGQSVGKVGATGTAYGLHVHYMLIRGGGWSWINPAPYMTNSVCGY